MYEILNDTSHNLPEFLKWYRKNLHQNLLRILHQPTCHPHYYFIEISVRCIKIQKKAMTIVLGMRKHRSCCSLNKTELLPHHPRTYIRCILWICTKIDRMSNKWDTMNYKFLNFRRFVIPLYLAVWTDGKLSTTIFRM